MTTPAIEVSVAIDHPGWRASVRGPAAVCRRATLSALALASRSRRRRAVAFLLTGDAEMRRLNRHYRGMNAPTNVLSFPHLPGEQAPRGEATHLGDVALAFETVAREAAEQGKSVRSHLSHLAVHGVLHLVGFDHRAVAEAEAMEALERRILGKLGIADPYLLPEDRR